MKFLSHFYHKKPPRAPVSSPHGVYSASAGEALSPSTAATELSEHSTDFSAYGAAPSSSSGGLSETSVEVVVNPLEFLLKAPSREREKAYARSPGSASSPACCSASDVPVERGRRLSVCSGPLSEDDSELSVTLSISAVQGRAFVWSQP
eukprot:RCo005435